MNTYSIIFLLDRKRYRTRVSANTITGAVFLFQQKRSFANAEILSIAKLPKTLRPSFKQYLQSLFKKP